MICYLVRRPVAQQIADPYYRHTIIENSPFALSNFLLGDIGLVRRPVAQQIADPYYRHINSPFALRDLLLGDIIFGAQTSCPADCRPLLSTSVC